MPRQTRQEEVASERRRRKAGSLDRMAEMKLAIPEKVQTDHPDATFRWINDTGNRMYFKTQQDDWDKVEGVEPIPVGTSQDGKPVYAHLCRKPKEFWNEDQSAAMEAIAEREKGLARNAKSDPQDNRSEDVSYAVPGNTITTSGYTP